MSVQRYISTSFWEDEWVATLAIPEKLLYLYLLTNPLTNIAGVYKITTRRIVFDTGLKVAAVASIMARFKADGKAYQFEEYVVLPSWPRHQRYEEREKIRLGIISILQDLPTEVINFLDGIEYSFDLDQIRNTIIAYKNRIGISGTTKRKVLEKTNGKCARCGSESDLIVHHIKALSDGGESSIANLEALCVLCHNRVHLPYLDCKENPDKVSPVPNYSDSDSDSDSDIDTDSDSDSIS